MCKRCGFKSVTTFELLTHHCVEPHPSVCVHCDAKFSHERTRDDHVRTTHLPPKHAYVCPFCCAIYEDRHSIRQHWLLSRTCPGGEIPLDFFTRDHDSTGGAGHGRNGPRSWVLRGNGIHPVLGVSNRNLVNPSSCSGGHGDPDNGDDDDSGAHTTLTGCADYDSRLGPKKILERRRAARRFGVAGFSHKRRKTLRGADGDLDCHNSDVGTTGGVPDAPPSI
jgi:hypothetical protein